MTMLNKLEKRILDIAYKKGLSHLSSCLTAVGIIDHIFLVKKADEPFVLDNGHSGLALYVVLEKFHFYDAEELFDDQGVHPDRIAARDYTDTGYTSPIDCSTGSLGQGLPIAVGMAIADQSKIVWCLTSDGAMAEGSNWEALRIAGELRLENLRILCNANGYGAYSKIETNLLDTRMQLFYPSLVQRTNMFKYPDYLQGIAGHYHVLTKEEYEEIIKP